MRVLQIEGMKGKENGILGWMVSYDIHMYVHIECSFGHEWIFWKKEVEILLKFGFKVLVW
jgi:hypothetical protein